MTRQLTEEQLRAYMRCSEFYNFGGEIETPMKTRITEYVYIRIILDLMKNPNFDFKFSLNANLKHAERFLKLKELYDVATGQEFIRHAAIAVDEIFKLIKPNVYIPVFGSFDYPVRVAESMVTVRLASLLATKVGSEETSRITHAVTFSPFVNTRDMENDLVQVIKTMTLVMANPLKHIYGASKMKLHIFSLNPAGPGINYAPIECNSKTVKKWAPYIELPIRQLESNYHYPIVPCNYSCPYKQQCQIDPDRRRE